MICILFLQKQLRLAISLWQYKIFCWYHFVPSVPNIHFFTIYSYFLNVKFCLMELRQTMDESEEEKQEKDEGTVTEFQPRTLGHDAYT